MPVFYGIPDYQEDRLLCKELLHFAFQAIRAEKNPVLQEVRYISPKLPLHFLESKVLLCQNTAAIPNDSSDKVDSQCSSATYPQRQDIVCNHNQQKDFVSNCRLDSSDL